VGHLYSIRPTKFLVGRVDHPAHPTAPLHNYDITQRIVADRTSKWNWSSS